MKRSLIALILAAAVFGASPASAAEWKDGRSPAQPYAGVPEVDLSQTMGYIMLYPRAKMPVEHFCDVLEIYLPREDVERGEGTLRLYDESGEILSVEFEDEEQVGIRKLSEDELNGLMWGSGVCIDVYLPVSLTIGKDYYVTMDEGCFTAADGAVVSLGYTGKEVWVPVVVGDFGINALAYYDTGEEEPAESEAVPVPVTQPAADGEEKAEPEEVNGEVTLAPEKGDKVRFDLLMGGDADVAVLYSENGSVLFPERSFLTPDPARFSPRSGQSHPSTGHRWSESVHLRILRIPDCRIPADNNPCPESDHDGKKHQPRQERGNH